MKPQRVTGTIRLPRRHPESHKGTYGRVLVVAGSTGMLGAAVLAVEGALRSGAGLVELGAPDRIAVPLAARLVCSVLSPLPSTPSGGLAFKALQPILDRSVAADVAAIGPGLRLDPSTVELLYHLLPSLSIPVVLDADGLNAVAHRPRILTSILTPTILTPHPGELGRLLGRRTSEIQRDREGAALSAARDFKAVVVLKGHRTVVTDGRRIYVNRTGNPGMATGGAGDVLTGVIAALVGQGLRPFDAACLGARVHGLAGDRAARRLSAVSVTAEDIVDELGPAFRTVGG